MRTESRAGTFRQSKIQETMNDNISGKTLYFRMSTAHVLELLLSGRGFGHLESSSSKLKWTVLNVPPLLPTTARRMFNMLVGCVKESISSVMRKSALGNVTADGWASY